MSEYLLLILGALALALGAVLGYFTRQNIAKYQKGSAEERVQKKLSEAKQEANNIVLEAKRKAMEISEEAKKSAEQKNKEINQLKNRLERKQGILDQKISDHNNKEAELQQSKEEVENTKEKIKEIKEKKESELEEIGNVSKEDARKEIFKEAEQESKKEIEEKISRMEKEGEERFQSKAKEILAFAVQRSVPSSVSELTTTSISLSDDEVKGRIIGKEGRNIRAFEQVTGVELMVDDSPGVVFLSSFDPMRREVAKIALQKLIKDSRIQPARIEKIVRETEEEIPRRIEKIGEETALKLKVFGLNSKIHQLLGKLNFRSSFGQNVLQHSLEVAYLASNLAKEIGDVDAKVAKKAGLLHDIGKAVDSEIEGSHVEIGLRILEKFGVEKEVLDAMKSHHEDYPYETTEAIIVQTADAISSSRPGVRKDTSENYLKRLEDLEQIAASFAEVRKAYAIEAGREIRVFVKSGEVDDWQAKKLAKEIARSIEEELNYPGEIKVNVIRETRSVEHAR